MYIVKLLGSSKREEERERVEEDMGKGGGRETDSKSGRKIEEDKKEREK